MYKQQPEKRFKTKDFEELCDNISASKSDYVDAKSFRNGWKKGWVCYIDLLGFSQMCERSNDSTVNSIVKFHKILTSSLRNFPSKFFQFTDCCFYISDDLALVLNFALETMKSCCAMNELAFRTKRTVLGHFLLRPRITIAQGDYLVVENLSNSYLVSGLNKYNFLAGSGIVKAYRLEKKSFSHAITINLPPEYLNNATIGGEKSGSKTGFSYWLESNRDSNTVHLPWPFLKCINKKAGNLHFVTTSNQERKSMMTNLISTHDCMSSEFFNDEIDLSVGKHPNALMKFILALHRYPSKGKSISREIVHQIRNLYPRN